MQYRRPVGGGPSGKRCPRCPPHRAQCTSVRIMKNARSMDVATAPSSDVQKLGHPVPLSYLAEDEKSGWWQPAHENTPCRFSSFSGLEYAHSVFPPRSTRYAAGSSNARHSASVLSTGKRPVTPRSDAGPLRPDSHATAGASTSPAPTIVTNCRRPVIPIA